MYDKSQFADWNNGNHSLVVPAPAFPVLKTTGDVSLILEFVFENVKWKV